MRRGTLLLLICGSAAVLALLGAFIGIHLAVLHGTWVVVLDRATLGALRRAHDPVLTGAAVGLTLVGGKLVTPAVTVAVAALLAATRRRLQPVLLIGIAVAGSFVLTLAADLLFQRPRPPDPTALLPVPTTQSFPSGHALNATVVAGVIAYVLLQEHPPPLRRLAVVAAATGWTAAVGFSRVYLAEHWPSDVVAGWAVGLAWLAAVVVVHRLLAAGLHRRTADPAVPAAAGAGSATEDGRGPARDAGGA